MVVQDNPADGTLCRTRRTTIATVVFQHIQFGRGAQSVERGASARVLQGQERYSAVQPKHSVYNNFCTTVKKCCFKTINQTSLSVRTVILSYISSIFSWCLNMYVAGLSLHCKPHEIFMNLNKTCQLPRINRNDGIFLFITEMIIII